MSQGPARRPRRTWWKAATATALALTLLTGGASYGQGVEILPEQDEIVAIVLDGGGDDGRAAVESLGGEVTGELGLINGSTARIRYSDLPALRELLPTVHITRDLSVVVEPGAAEPVEPVEPAPADTEPAAEPVAEAEPSTSLADVNALIGADALHAQGLTGAGVDVAVIDSGITPVDGLDGEKVVFGPDLSFDSQYEGTRNLDTYGHGTSMAAIIAADDGPAGDGVAPGARLVSVKVGAANGAVDVSQIIAAIDWVVQNRQSGDLDIRVLNLSLGTDSTQRAALDPLAHAVDVAWSKGVFVAAAVGNDGRGDGSVANPAINPNIMSVGAVDSWGSRSRADVGMADFSSIGNGKRRPDLAAPGARVLSARVPGSNLDVIAPSARRGEHLFRGSGTSQATAAVSGAAALLLEQRPELTPAEIKELLLDTAYELPEHKKVAGRGLVDVAAAAAAPTPNKVRAHKKMSGNGSLDAARGSARLVESGQVLDGERDIFGNPFDSARHARQALAESAWAGGTWNGGTWSGGTWSGGTWSGGTWSGGTWSGGTWSGDAWAGGTWSGGTWSGGTWSGGTWSGALWNGGTWSGGTWSGDAWAGGTWSGGTWSGDAWAGGTWSGGTWSGGTWSGGTWSGRAWAGGTWSGGTWSGGTWSGSTFYGNTWA